MQMLIVGIKGFKSLVNFHFSNPHPNLELHQVKIQRARWIFTNELLYLKQS